MPRCAFLTMDGPTRDDELVREPLESRGWRLDAVPWRRPRVDWSVYDLVVIRSTWDYHRCLVEFLEVLEAIERAGPRLENRLDLVRWNAHKTYLRDLSGDGIPVVPTVYRESLRPGELAGLFAETGGEEIVIKPVVGASAEGAYRIAKDPEREATEQVEAFFADTALMAQPLARAVLDHGEYSLSYFDGAFGHAILKTPRAGDYRSQEEYGSVIRPVTADGELREAGAAAMAALPETPLYARADFVRSNRDSGCGSAWWLMELELIEPSLYLRTDPAAPERFARAIDRRRP